MARSVRDFEKEVTLKLKWKAVEEIPNFPLNSFEDVRRQVEAGQWGIGIHFSAANEFAFWRSGAHAVFCYLLASTPFIAAIASLVLAFALGNYWLLAGAISGFAGQFLSNPYNPFRGFFGGVCFWLFLLFLYGLWQGKETITYLSAFFVFPFVINRYLYELNQTELKAVAMSSEVVFIYLYQTGNLGLKDSAGKGHWCRQA